jgi:hypothetical protein
MRALLLVLAGGVVGVAMNQSLALLGSSTPPVPAELRIADANGVIRAHLWIDEANDVRFGLFDGTGMRRAGMSVFGESSALFLQDEEDGECLVIEKRATKRPRIGATVDGSVTALVPLVPVEAIASELDRAADAPKSPLTVMDHDFRPMGANSVSDFVGYRVRVKNESESARVVAVHVKLLDESGFMLGEDYCEEKRIEPGLDAWFTDECFVNKGSGVKVSTLEASALVRS